MKIQEVLRLDPNELSNLSDIRTWALKINDLSARMHSELVSGDTNKVMSPGEFQTHSEELLRLHKLCGQKIEKMIEIKTVLNHGK